MSAPTWLSHWGLRQSPFATTAGVGQSYPTQAFEEATARIEYLIAQQRRMGVLVGEPGEGKSTILQAMQDSGRRRGIHVALVDAVALSQHELLMQTTSQLGGSPDPGDSLPTLWRRLEDTLAHHRWQGQSSLLMIDDADQAGADIQRQLLRMSGMESTADARWTLLIATQTARLASFDESLLHRIDLRIDLFPWTYDDTVGYVQHSLIDAGCLEPLFTDEALHQLQTRAQGVPRHVARLADFALVAGAAAEATCIEAEQIDAAFEQLRWSPPAAAPLV